jgi:CubicO group peptidase (beta-lactamase class C family)
LSDARTDPPLVVGADVDGHVASAVRHAITNGDEVGVQVAAVSQGNLLVQVAGGWFGPLATSHPVTSDALFPVYSATKGVIAAACLRLLDMGLLVLDQPLAQLWPAFGAAGKERVSVRHMLTHTAGVPQMPAGTTVEQMCDWNYMTEAVAALTPRWEPGTQVAYHAYTFGWLAGEVLRRATGKAASAAGVVEAVRQSVAAPAGTDDFLLGVPLERHASIVDLVGVAGRAHDADSLYRSAIPVHLDTGPEVYGRSDVRQAVLPGAGAHATATALARIYDWLARQDPDSWITRGQAVWEGRFDAVVGRPVGRGLGFWVSGSTAAQGPPLDGGPGRFGHPGAGGTIAWGDRELGAGFAVTRNRLTPLGWNDPSVRRLVAAAYVAARRALGVARV